MKQKTNAGEGRLTKGLVYNIDNDITLNNPSKLPSLSGSRIELAIEQFL